MLMVTQEASLNHFRSANTNTQAPNACWLLGNVKLEEVSGKDPKTSTKTLSAVSRHLRVNFLNAGYLQVENRQQKFVLFKHISHTIKLFLSYEVNNTNQQFRWFQDETHSEKESITASFQMTKYRKVRVFKPNSDNQGNRSSHKPSQELVGLYRVKVSTSLTWCLANSWFHFSFVQDAFTSRSEYSPTLRSE